MNRRSLAVFLATVLILSSTACSAGVDTSAALKSGMSPTAKPAEPATAKPVETPKGGSAAATAAPAKSPADGKSATVPLPSGATKLESGRVVKIGEAVELPASNLVIQVTNVRTTDKDAQNDWVLADVVIGNKGKEKEPISSVVSFSVVSSDWHWYGFSITDAMAMIAKDVAAGVQTTLFDDNVEPGQAKKGTAMAIVPKSAKNLALVYQSTKIIAVGNEPRDPYVFVSLGLRGDFPGVLVPEDAAPAKAGEVYKIGQAFRLPKTGIVAQVNTAWERTTPGKQARLDADKKFVLIDISMKKPDGAMSLDPRHDYRLVSSDGSVNDSLELTSQIIGEEGTRGFTSSMGRGVIVGIVPKSATGLALKVAPVGDSGDVALVDLGLGGAYVAKAVASPTAAKATATVAAKTPTPAGKATATPTAKTSPTARATATPASRATPTRTPAGLDASKLPPRMKAIAVPPGFRLTSHAEVGDGTDGDFDVAEATWLGTLGVIETSNFYSDAASHDWTVSEGEVSETVSHEIYSNNDDPNLTLEITIKKTSRGIEATLTMTRN